MPPPRLPDRRRTRAAVIGGMLGVAVSAGAVWAVVRFAAENPEEVRLGDAVFSVGKAERLAREVDDRGPLLFQDPLARGGGRNIYVQHLGPDPEAGWVAVEARLADDPRCAVTWDRRRAAFVDCRGARHPPDGAGLATYPATVADGVVRIDLRNNPGR